MEGWLSSEEARASSLLSFGKLAEARAVLDRVLSEEVESSDIWTLGTCLCLLTEVQVLQGELEAAHTSAARVMAFPGIKENARMYTWVLSSLALVHLGAGEIKLAQQIISQPPPEGVGYDLSYRWQLVECAVELAHGHIEIAHYLAQKAQDWVTQKGHRKTRSLAEKICTQPEMPVTEFIYLILVENG